MEQSNQSEYTETFRQLCVLVIKSSCCYLNMVNLKILGHVNLINTHLLMLSTHPKQPICGGGYGFMQISNVSGILNPAGVLTTWPLPLQI